MHVKTRSTAQVIETVQLNVKLFPVSQIMLYNDVKFKMPAYLLSILEDQLLQY